MENIISIHDDQIKQEDRNRLTRHPSYTLWLTGLSASGKSTIAQKLSYELHHRGVLTYVLDGDILRKGLNKDLKFTKEDREENIRRVAEVSKLLNQAGTISISAFISPYEETRAKAKDIIGSQNFVEVFVQCPIDVCEERDPKGLYEKAREGNIKNFTGISDPYEEPKHPDITVNTDRDSVDDCVEQIIDYLDDKGFLNEERNRGNQPHGGKLVHNKIIQEKEPNGAKEIQVSDRVINDAEMIGIGAYSPLTGFMDKKEAKKVIHDMSLKNGLLWPIPILLPVDKDVEEGEELLLKDKNDDAIAKVQVEEVFTLDKENLCQKVFGTTEKDHPGVKAVLDEPDQYVSGEVKLLKKPKREKISEDSYLEPRDVRKVIEQKGWQTTVAFQTRNPIHRAHEYIQKSALEAVDGLLIHPIVGKTKSSDIPAHVRMQCYEKIIDEYYSEENTYLSVMPYAMRYAGPREAILHAIIRQNYGCTHFIIGRDHAGVGDYYGTYEAQELFKTIQHRLDIKPLMFEYAYYCNKCENVTTSKTCPHDKKNHIYLSGTKVREKLRNGESLPKEFSRKEVADILQKWSRNK